MSLGQVPISDQAEISVPLPSLSGETVWIWAPTQSDGHTLDPLWVNPEEEKPDTGSSEEPVVHNDIGPDHDLQVRGGQAAGILIHRSHEDVSLHIAVRKIPCRKLPFDLFHIRVLW